MLKSVIFDMDGVLLDSEPLHKEAVAILMNKLGIGKEILPPEDIIGMSLEMICAQMIKRGKLNLTLEELLKMQTEVTYEYFKHIDLVETEGLTTFLKEIKSHDFLIGVASSAPVDLINMFLKKLQISEYFDVVCGVDFITNPKPDPEIYLLTAELLGVKPEECLVIEDSAVGISAAKDAKMKCIALKNIYTSEKEQSRADRIVDGFAVLEYDYIKQLF